MKKVVFMIQAIWCVITSFITPLWLTLTFLNISGQIYNYDYSMDEGTAGILGVVLLLAWLLFTVLPDGYYIKKVTALGRKYFYITVGVILLLMGMCMAMSGWNLVRFWMMPGGAV